MKNNFNFVVTSLEYPTITFTGVEILIKYKSQVGRTLKDLVAFASSNEQFIADIDKLGEKVMQFASQFDMPGNDDI